MTEIDKTAPPLPMFHVRSIGPFSLAAETWVHFPENGGAAVIPAGQYWCCAWGAWIDESTPEIVKYASDAVRKRLNAPNLRWRVA